jgi:regulator of cell morphogenesis and NO signaling
MARKEKQAEYDIDIFKNNHSNIDDKLSDLKNILVKHLRGIGMAAETTELLFQIFSLEEDLSRHTFIEDVVLIPMVQQLEQRIYEHK